MNMSKNILLYFSIFFKLSKLSQLDRPHVVARLLAYFVRNGSFYVAQPYLYWHNVLRKTV